MTYDFLNIVLEYAEILGIDVFLNIDFFKLSYSGILISVFIIDWFHIKMNKILTIDAYTLY